MRLNLVPLRNWWDRITDKSYLFEWHKWFAWVPVIVNDELVWLEWIETRQVEIEHYDYYSYEQEYRNAQV